MKIKNLMYVQIYLVTAQSEGYTYNAVQMESMKQYTVLDCTKDCFNVIAPGGEHDKLTKCMNYCSGLIASNKFSESIPGQEYMDRSAVKEDLFYPYRGPYNDECESELFLPVAKPQTLSSKPPSESNNNLNTSKDTSKDVSKDTSKDASKDTSKDASKDTIKDTSKDTFKQLEKEVSTNAVNNSQSKVILDSEEVCYDSSEDFVNSSPSTKMPTSVSSNSFKGSESSNSFKYAYSPSQASYSALPTNNSERYDHLSQNSGSSISFSSVPRSSSASSVPLSSSASSVPLSSSASSVPLSSSALPADNSECYDDLSQSSESSASFSSAPLSSSATSVPISSSATSAPLPFSTASVALSSSALPTDDSGCYDDLSQSSASSSSSPRSSSAPISKSNNSVSLSLGPLQAGMIDSKKTHADLSTSSSSMIVSTSVKTGAPATDIGSATTSASMTTSSDATTPTNSSIQDDKDKENKQAGSSASNGKLIVPSLAYLVGMVMMW